MTIQAAICHFCHAGNNWDQNTGITGSIKICIMHKNAPCKMDCVDNYFYAKNIP